MKERIMCYELRNLKEVLDNIKEEDFISEDIYISDIHMSTQEHLYQKRKAFSFEQRNENEVQYTFTGCSIKGNYIFVNRDDCEDIILYNSKLNRVIY